MSELRYRQLVWSTDRHTMPVVINFPDPMTPEEIDELKEVIALWFRGLERRACPPSPSKTED